MLRSEQTRLPAVEKSAGGEREPRVCQRLKEVTAVIPAQASIRRELFISMVPGLRRGDAQTRVNQSTMSL
jgi:hypothetical protein